MRFPATGWRPFDGHGGLRNSQRPEWPRNCGGFGRTEINLESPQLYLADPLWIELTRVRELSRFELDVGWCLWKYYPNDDILVSPCPKVAQTAASTLLVWRN